MISINFSERHIVSFFVAHKVKNFFCVENFLLRITAFEFVKRLNCCK